MKKGIVITGGTGRLGNELKKVKTNYKLFFPTKKNLWANHPPPPWTNLLSEKDVKGKNTDCEGHLIISKLV